MKLFQTIRDAVGKVIAESQSDRQAGAGGGPAVSSPSKQPADDFKATPAPTFQTERTAAPAPAAGSARPNADSVVESPATVTQPTPINGPASSTARVDELTNRGFGYLEGRIWFHFKNCGFDYIPKEGDVVDFTPMTSEKGQAQAVEVRLSGKPFLPADFYMKTLEKWSDIRLDRRTLQSLYDMTLKEDWDYIEHPWAQRRPYWNLKNYLNNTFLRAFREGKIKQRDGHAAWNTGLVDNLYRPIHASFRLKARANPERLGSWSFEYFCVVGVGPEGDAFRKRFAGDYPVEARFFHGMDDIYFDPDTPFPFEINDHHVLVQGIEENRYPSGFLEKFAGGFDVDRFRSEKGNYLNEVASRVNQNHELLRDCVTRIEKAVELAKLRGRWNYRSIVPIYYPKFDQVSFLLPLCLQDDETTDAALVFQKETLGDGSKQYVFRTIFNLAMAYQNARLVAKPISDWLNLDKINGSNVGAGEVADAKIP